MSKSFPDFFEKSLIVVVRSFWPGLVLFAAVALADSYPQILTSLTATLIGGLTNYYVDLARELRETWQVVQYITLLQALTWTLIGLALICLSPVVHSVDRPDLYPGMKHRRWLLTAFGFAALAWVINYPATAWQGVRFLFNF
jgi:hypothetical protein